MSNTNGAGTSLAPRKPILPKVKLGQSFVVMPHGLAVEGQPSLDEWLEVGALFDKADSAVRWWRGDWLAYGEKAYGKTYREAMEKTGLSYDTLAEEKYVASNVEFWVRTQNLSWMHHKVVAPLSPEEQQYWLNFAEEHQLNPSELRDKIKGAERLPWLRYTDVWNFSECNDRFGLKNFDGRIPGQIVQNVLYYYTKLGDFVIDPMAGGGTTLDVCTKCDEVKRECLAFDIKQLRPDIIKADATKPWPTERQADLVFIDPPYASQQGESYGLPVDKFKELMTLVLKQTKNYLKGTGTLAILIAPMAIKTDYTDLPFILYQLAESLGFKLRRRIHVPVGTEQVGAAATKKCKDTRTMVAVARDLLIMQKWATKESLV